MQEVHVWKKTPEFPQHICPTNPEDLKPYLHYSQDWPTRTIVLWTGIFVKTDMEEEI